MTLTRLILCLEHVFSFALSDLLTGDKKNTKVAPSLPVIHSKSIHGKNNIFRAKNILRTLTRSSTVSTNIVTWLSRQI